MKGNKTNQFLEINNLKTRFFTDRGTVRAVNGISYQLDHGETLGIVGESGCGKTVHALSILGLVPDPPGKVTGGEVLLNGINLRTLSADELRHVRGMEIGMIFQDPITSLNPVIQVGEQIGEALRYHLRLSKKEALARTIELLNLVGIPNPEDRVKSYPYELSGGMCQRVMIAIALACNPSLLIADEPTTALDVTIQAQIIRLVKKLRADLGMSIIWITHDLGVIAGLADRILVMYAGYIVEQALVHELFQNPCHPYTLGLLRSLPRVDQGRDGQAQLIQIKGSPPNMIDPIPGCPFAPRCPYTQSRCWEENPALQEIRPQHQAACWVDVRDLAAREVQVG